MSKNVRFERNPQESDTSRVDRRRFSIDLMGETTHKMEVVSVSKGSFQEGEGIQMAEATRGSKTLDFCNTNTPIPLSCKVVNQSYSFDRGIMPLITLFYLNIISDTS